VLATANLLVLSLWVLPGEIRKRLNAERNLPEKKKEGDGESDSARADRGSGQASWPAGSTRIAACGKRCVGRFWRGGEVSGRIKEVEFWERGNDTH
jgi:hypothetical protein